MSSDFLNQLDLLSSGSMIYAALKDAATVAVCSHSDTILTDSIKYELKLQPRVSYRLYKRLSNQHTLLSSFFQRFKHF